MLNHPGYSLCVLHYQAASESASGSFILYIDSRGARRAHAYFSPSTSCALWTIRLRLDVACAAPLLLHSCKALRCLLAVQKILLKFLLVLATWLRRCWSLVVIFDFVVVAKAAEQVRGRAELPVHLLQLADLAAKAVLLKNFAAGDLLLGAVDLELGCASWWLIWTCAEASPFCWASDLGLPRSVIWTCPCCCTAASC